MGIGPVFAVPKLLARHGLKVDDIDLWELNEAFAVQVIYCRDRLGIDPGRLNVNGGSISIGHPFGMTGSRMVGTLANEMVRRKARYGVVTMCVGGGQGAAGLVRAVCVSGIHQTSRVIAVCHAHAIRRRTPSIAKSRRRTLPLPAARRYCRIGTLPRRGCVVEPWARAHGANEALRIEVSPARGDVNPTNTSRRIRPGVA